MTRYRVHWRNQKRSGIAEVQADSPELATAEVIRRIESKYYWQGKCQVTACQPIQEAT